MTYSAKFVIINAVVNFYKNGYVMCTVKFNTLKIQAHNTNMGNKYYSTTNMQKKKHFPLCLTSFDTAKE